MISSVCLVVTRGKQHKSSDLRKLMARRLKAARFAYVESATEAARLLDVTPQVLNAYEKGRNYPDESFLIRFSELTGCPLEWIIRGKIRAEMPTEMAVRIGHYYPDLLQELAAEPSGKSKAAALEKT